MFVLLARLAHMRTALARDEKATAKIREKW